MTATNQTANHRDATTAETTTADTTTAGPGATGDGRPDTRTVLRSSEFTCPSCVAKIEKQLLRTPGVSAATVHFSTGRIEVEHDPQLASTAALVAAVRKAGYRAAQSAF